MIDTKFKNKVFQFYKQRTPDCFSKEHHEMMLVTNLSHAIDAFRFDRHADLEHFRGTITTAQEQICTTEAWVAHWYPEWYDRYISDTVEDALCDALLRYLVLIGDESVIDKKGVLPTYSCSFVENVRTLVSSVERRTFVSSLKALLKKHQYIAWKDFEFIVSSKMRYYEYRGLDNGKRL